MSDGVPQALLDAAKREIRSVEAESGEPVSRDVAVKIALGLFDIREEWSAISEETGEFGQSTPIAGSPLEVIAGYGPGREIGHRFVLSTSWRRVKARIEWEDA